MLQSTRSDSKYIVKSKSSTKLLKKTSEFSCNGVVFAGGVLGTIPLLLKLKLTNLPKLSNMVGKGIRTNSESLLGVTSTDTKKDFFLKALPSVQFYIPINLAILNQ